MSAKRGIKVVLIVVGFLVAVFVAFSVFIWFSGGSAEPSAAATAQRTEPLDEEARLFEVVPGRAEAQFIIGEVLRGLQNEVVGTTDQIDGSFSLGFDNGFIEIGEFVINLRSIRTDDEMRDRTIRSLILETNRDEYEFSTFVPTGVEGAPSSFSPGDSFDLQVTGDLTIRHITRSVEFSMTFFVDSEDEVSGSASTEVLWDDFEISIPYVGGNSIVSSVDNTVELRMEFLARAR